MKRTRNLILAVLACTVPTICAAQSTSAWVHVEPSDAAPRVNGALGASYVSMVLEKVSVYSKSNWYTRLVERNRSALATVTVAGNLSGGKPIEDKRVSPPVALQHSPTTVDFGWSQSLLNNMPVSFTSLQVAVGISKTATDGVDNLITAANDISTKAPTLSASTATLGIVSSAKMLADVLFNRQLATEKLKSNSPLTQAENGLLAPGVYVVFAADAASDYDKYQGEGAHDLKWDTASRVLTYKGSPITAVSYFVVNVAYRASIYPLEQLPNAALTLDKSWARLYRSALTQVDNFTDISKVNDTRLAVATVKADAEQLLNEDADFVQSERAAIQAAARNELNKRLRARYDQLKANSGEGGPGTLSLAPIQ